MKKCLKCRKMYEDAMWFCTEDGSLLDNRSVNAANAGNIFGKPHFNQMSQPTIAVNLPPFSPITPKASNRRLRIGLVGLVFVMFILSGVFVWAGIKIAIAKRAAELTETADKPTIDAPKTKKQDTPKTKNVEVAEKGVTTGDADLNQPAATEPAKSPQPNSYNGRVIMLNAVVRDAPTMEADETAILQLDEPVQIGQSAGPNSPWFRVVTHAGIKGWMHGSTIEYN